MARAAQQNHAWTQSERNVTAYPDPLNTFIWNAIVDRATDVHLHCVENGVTLRVIGTGGGRANREKPDFITR